MMILAPSCELQLLQVEKGYKSAKECGGLLIVHPKNKWLRLDPTYIWCTFWVWSV